MEFTKVEISAVREAADKLDETIVALTELELVLVGGGTGDIHLG